MRALLRANASGGRLPRLVACALRADNKHLRGEFEKAWPDAERYRWLREYAGRGAAGSIFDNFSGTAIDECIDAARAAREGRG